MVGARAREKYDEQAKERQKVRKGNQRGTSPVTVPDLSKGDARDLAGKAVGVSGSLIDRATKVLDAQPELAKAVDEGRMSVTRAAKGGQLPRPSSEFNKALWDPRAAPESFSVRSRPRANLELLAAIDGRSHLEPGLSVVMLWGLRASGVRDVSDDSITLRSGTQQLGDRSRGRGSFGRRR